VSNSREKSAPEDLGEENPDVNPSLQIFNKTKCANLVSNVADATDQSRLGGGSAVPNPLFELRPVLNQVGMAREAV
jgi:hypothetical protein